jgi:Holliday junction DNA helicase RuvA
MISRLAGILADVHEDTVLVDRDGVGFEVLVPRYAVAELASVRGRRVTLYTLAFLEGNPGGGNLIPRLVGFPHPEDKLFFNRFVTVKGMGIRKALKALAEPVATVAAAVEQGDAKALSRLPGIGARLADQMVAELRGKLEQFAVGAGEAPVEQTWSPAQRDALDVLAALGEKPVEARRWLIRAAELQPEIAAADEWVKAAYRAKAAAEG